MFPDGIEQRCSDVRRSVLFSPRRGLRTRPGRSQSVKSCGTIPPAGAPRTLWRETRRVHVHILSHRFRRNGPGRVLCRVYHFFSTPPARFQYISRDRRTNKTESYACARLRNGRKSLVERTVSSGHVPSGLSVFSSWTSERTTRTTSISSELKWFE